MKSCPHCGAPLFGSYTSRCYKCGRQVEIQEDSIPEIEHSATKLKHRMTDMLQSLRSSRASSMRFRLLHAPECSSCTRRPTLSETLIGRSLSWVQYYGEDWRFFKPSYSDIRDSYLRRFICPGCTEEAVRTEITENAKWLTSRVVLKALSKDAILKTVFDWLL
jgi:hypothetical protein